jgi:hypothetical protein
MLLQGRRTNVIQFYRNISSLVQQFASNINRAFLLTLYIDQQRAIKYFLLIIPTFWSLLTYYTYFWIIILQYQLLY